jgi:ATP-dependent exoDNAse (exonuclease V) beta subunit
MPPPRIKTIVASAGAGKTTRIVAEIAREIERRDPEAILATTFTVKAADELIERARAKLFDQGRAQEAARLLGARFGTVNAICGQIVGEHALDLGRSPRADVIPDELAARRFAIAADAAIARHAPELNALADAMGASEPAPARTARHSDWRITVRRLIEIARANGIDADGLAQSADRSVSTFLALLPASTASADDLDRALFDAVRAACAVAPAEPSATASPGLAALKAALRSHRDNRPLTWPDWARLAKAKAAKTKDGKAFADAVEAVCAAAARHGEHPRLREQCEAFIRGQFACAADAMSAYQRDKAQRGQMDFIDQETLALEALRTPSIAARLGERIERVFVDEFQDSSPLQIAIFTALAGLVDESTWVGDPKQAIYGFRNADSALTLAAFDGVRALNDEPADILSISYRSRAPIVGFVNDAFAKAFDAMGLPASEHAFSGADRPDAAFHHPAFAVWRLEGRQELQNAALASGVRDAIESGADWTVYDKGATTHRTLRAGDVAILCRSNDAAREIAAALSALGLKVAVERERLADTPHVEMTLAALRWVADPGDRLALAELVRFFGDDPTSDLWLQAMSAQDQDAALRSAVPIAEDLAALRAISPNLTPAELLEAILILPAVTARFEFWGEAETRFDDLEALRGFARSYEASCAGAGSAATPSGLILALNAEKPSRPKSLQSDAVAVMTYHAAKGLEWPLVVLTGLSVAPRPRLFREPIAEASSALDWRNPLANRWIRYWPWPYGGMSANVALADSALASEIGQEAARRAREEDTRLLYVGMTRARDYLVFAPPANGALNALAVLDHGGPGHIRLPENQGDPLMAGDAAYPVRLIPVAVDVPKPLDPTQQTFVRTARTIIERAPLRRRPSAEKEGGAYAVIERITLGPRLAIEGAPDMTRLGEAVHAIFAADRASEPAVDRRARAEAILARWGVHQVAAADVLAACDRLNHFLEARWPSAHRRREVPVHARLGDQLVSGRIDLLIEHNHGYAIIDHKSFPGSRDTWDARALLYGPQLSLYAEAVAMASGRSGGNLYVHMPIVGALLRIGILGDQA